MNIQLCQAWRGVLACLKTYFGFLFFSSKNDLQGLGAGGKKGEQGCAEQLLVHLESLLFIWQLHCFSWKALQPAQFDRINPSKQQNLISLRQMEMMSSCRSACADPRGRCQQQSLLQPLPVPKAPGWRCRWDTPQCPKFHELQPVEAAVTTLSPKSVFVLRPWAEWSWWWHLQAMPQPTRRAEKSISAKSPYRWSSDTCRKGHKSKVHFWVIFWAKNMDKINFQASMSITSAQGQVELGGVCWRQGELWAQKSGKKWGISTWADTGYNWG